MLPLRDHRPSGRFPFITYFILAANVLIFFYMFSLSPSGLEAFINQYALIPARIINGQDLHALITSMFLHGGLGHLFSNMLFLHIFGDNLEDALGHFKFLFYYLIVGLAGSFLQIFIDPTSTIPNLGASGAIAGIMGGYLLLFPREPIDILFSFGFIFRRSTVPAYFMLFYWFVIQLLLGFGSLGGLDQVGGGVAFFAHIGGFVAGFATLLPFRPLLRRHKSWA